MSRNKSTIAFSTLFLCFILLTQCYGSSNETKTTLMPTTKKEPRSEALQKENPRIQVLRASVYMDPLEFIQLQHWNQNYMDRHQGVYIELDNLLEEQAYTKLKKSSELGEAPDIMLIDNSWVQEFAASGYLQPVDSFYTNDTISDQMELMMNQVRWNGYIWGIPRELDPYVLVWNKKSVVVSEDKTVGLSPLQLLPVMKEDKADIPEVSPKQIYINSKDPYAFLSLLWSLGGQWSLDEGLTLGEHEQEVLVWLDTHTELNLTSEFEHSQSDIWQELVKGTYAMAITTLSDYWKYGKGAALDFSPLSSTKKSPLQGGWIQGKSFVVSSQLESDEQAKQWIMELTSKSAQLDLVDAERLPVLKSLYTYSFKDDKIEQEKILQSLEQGRVFTADPMMSSKLNLLLEKLHKVKQGEQNLAMLLTDLKSIWKSS